MNPFEVNLADIALEVKSDLKITWNGTEFNYTNEMLKGIHDSGVPATVFALVVYALVHNGKTDDKVKEWVTKAMESGWPSIEFNAPEGGALNVVSKENNPLLNQLVEGMETNDNE